MKAMFNGQELFLAGPRGFAGPDGTPIGTIISFMGTTAPKDYLLCDGAIYNIAEKKDLADFFIDQFGSANHFGGDGETTFAVPDLRNLFLRGYHGNAESQLSGEVGELQNGTLHPYIHGSGGVWIHPNGDDGVGPLNIDDPSNRYPGRWASVSEPLSDRLSPERYTSRPINTAVLYCIKAVDSVSRLFNYSEEERVIGTWTTGEPLYRKTVFGTAGPSNTSTLIHSGDIKLVTFASGAIYHPTVTVSGVTGGWALVPELNSQFQLISNNLYLFHTVSFWNGQPFFITFEYTKTNGLNGGV